MPAAAVTGPGYSRFARIKQQPDEQPVPQTTMFKKPPSNIKTSSPLRNSDRKKLKQSAITAFRLTPEEGEALVPVGIQSVKFSTHLNEHGVAYLYPGGNPLWITLGKGSEDLIPTIYTLWMKQDLLPFISTPSAVVPILVGGADLMIPGVIHCPPSLPEGQLVCVRQYVKKDGIPYLSPPLAVGRLALPTDKLRDAGQEKGKAVLVLHTWKDHLWELGSKNDPPADTPLPHSTGEISAEGLSNVGSDSDNESDEDDERAPTPPRSNAPSPSPHPAAEQSASSSASAGVSYTPQEITDLLLKSLIQAISKVLSTLPANKFPIPATVLYSTYILPNRPAFPTRVLPPENFPTPRSESPDSKAPPTIATELTIKSSSHKSLTTFLKSVEKIGLLTLKPPQKQQPDILITSVNASHPLVHAHSPFVTVKEVELTAAKKAARQERDGQAGSGSVGGGEVDIKELWKPHQGTVGLFEVMGASTNELYTPAEVRDLLEGYITSHNLINTNEKAYVNLDSALAKCLSSSSKGQTKFNVGEEETSPVEFLRRDDIVKGVFQRMQGWYEVKAPGKDAVTKKGTISPIQIITKIRQGRKACTFITGFEPFLVVDATDMAEELRKICAGATSVNPIPGKAAGSGMEVLVQGKQTKASLEYLMAKGIPKKWIVVSDVKGKK